jgi:stage V sporulation protein AE
MDYLWSFIIGGAICTIGQVLLSKTNLNPGRILVLFVTGGVILGAVGVYKPIAELGKAGATVPLTGFGYALYQGAFEGVDKSGLLGAFTGPVSSTAGGIAGAVVFGYLIAVLFNPNTKK